MHETRHQPKQRPALDEQVPCFRQVEPSLLQRQELAGLSAQPTLDGAIDENIKRFCEQPVRTEAVPTLSDGGDGISSLPSPVPSPLNSQAGNHLQKGDGSDGNFRLAEAAQVWSVCANRPPDGLLVH